MAEWKLPDEMIWHDLRELACDACEGIGTLIYGYGENEMGAGEESACSACHGTGLAGVEWHCVSDLHWDQCRSVRSWGLQGDIDEHADCRMRLIVDLERSE